MVSSGSQVISRHLITFRNLSTHDTQKIDNHGKPLYDFAASQILGVMSDCLNAKHAFAFGIDLQSLFAKMYLEDRQIVRRFLDHTLES